MTNDTKAPQPVPATKFIAVNADEPGDRGIYGYGDFAAEVLAAAARQMARLKVPPRLVAIAVSPALAAYLDEYGVNYDQDCWIRRHGDLADLAPAAEPPKPLTLEEAKARLQQFLADVGADLENVSPAEGRFTASIEFRRRGEHFFFVRADAEYLEPGAPDAGEEAPN